mmetsp:Transcript_52807/g.171844  ORF Transcript_52807/g.171844 Transcript_52807/m.171844 type:complete len:423 (+) Transcript_52807:37-1305(+)
MVAAMAVRYPWVTTVAAFAGALCAIVNEAFHDIPMFVDWVVADPTRAGIASLSSAQAVLSANGVRKDRRRALKVARREQTSTFGEPFGPAPAAERHRAAHEQRRVPAESALAGGLRNGHLAATFDIVEAVTKSSQDNQFAFRGLHGLEGAWYAFEVRILRGLDAAEEVSRRRELQKVRCLGALADSRHVARYVTAWCEEVACLPDVLREAVGSAWSPSQQLGQYSSPEGYSIALVVQTELCEGLSLKAWMDQRTCPPAAPPSSAPVLEQTVFFSTELQFAEHLTKAFRECQGAGLTHRGLRPENITVVSSGGKTLLKIASFDLECVDVEDKLADSLAAACVILQLLLPRAWSSSTREAAVAAFRCSGGAEVPRALAAQLPGHAALLARMAAGAAAGLPPPPAAAEVHAAMKRLRTEGARPTA